jgi:hypothetical protein
MRLRNGLLVLFFVWGLSRVGADSLPADSIKPGIRLISNGLVKVEAGVIRKPAVVTIGDRIQVRVVIRHPKALAVSAPVPANPEEVAVVEQKHRIEYKADTAVEFYDLKLAVFKVGEGKLSPWLAYYQEQGELCAVSSDSIPLSVKSLLRQDMQDINDLKPQASFPNLVPLWILLGVLIAGVWGFYVWRVLSKWRSGRQAQTPLLSPWDEALSALNSLPVEDWLSKGQIKRLYYTVSEIIKRYLVRRFGFPAVDQTTSEIITELRRRRIAEVERFSSFFLDADLVKYSKFVPGEPKTVQERARELIRLTTPEPEPVPAGGESGGRK